MEIPSQSPTPSADEMRQNLLAILAKLRLDYEEACKPYAAELCRLEAVRP